MRFKIIILLFIAFCATSCGGPRKVVDYTVISTLVEIHKKESDNYRGHKEREGVNAGLQKLVTKTQNEYREISDKIQRRYTDVSILIAHVGKLPQIITLMNDIQQYQVEALGMVQDNPEFVLIAINTEILLTKRVTRLYKYVYLNAIIGTDINKMPMAKRFEIVDHVITELKVIRGLCYGINRKMKSAIRGKGYRVILDEFDISFMYQGIDRAQMFTNSLPIRQ